MTKEDRQLATEQLERISGKLGAIGETVDYTEIAIKALQTEPCEDAISRQKAIAHLTKARLLGDSRSMAEIFAEVPSLGTGWVSTKEAYPQYNKEVLLCTSHGTIYIGYYASCWGRDKWQKGPLTSDEIEAVAWMPLPEPYKAKNEEGS